MPRTSIKASGFIKRETTEADRRINDRVIGYVDDLNAQGRISYNVSDYLFFGSASRDAEMAGIKGAFVGSLMTSCNPNSSKRFLNFITATAAQRIAMYSLAGEPHPA